MTRKRTYRMEDGDTVVIDDRLTIIENTDDFILASSENSTFACVKKTATFSYAFVTIVPGGNGELIALGNAHHGIGSINPFEQLD